jgi:hypothetical protein
MPRTAYNWSGSELACWDSVASHSRCPKRTYRRAIVIDGRLWCHFPIAVWMPEGGTLSLLETKVVSIIVFSSVVFLLPIDCRGQWALLANQFATAVFLS